MMESPATAVVSGVMMGAGGGNHGYPDSVDSSPRSRGGDSWDEFPSSAAAAAAAASAASRLRLMCSYGGRIVPRPTDKSLCYLGGETRIVVVDRHSSLAELTAKLSRNLLSGRPFTLKYQLPNEDLDSLISVTTDEDLDNMIEEYDRLLAGSGSGGGGAPGGASAGVGGSGRSGRLRLFLFPAKSESAPPSAIGSLLDESKSETWFEDALNSAMGGMGIDGLPRGLSADSASVNCLLGLEEDSSVHSRGGVAAAITGARAGISEPEQLVIPRPDSSGKLPRQGQDVHSVPDSPMLDTTSSFGSTSSAPSLSNLPPIRVRPDERPSDHRITGLDDQFAHMNLSSAAAAAAAAGQRLDEGFKEPIYPPQHQASPSIPPASALGSTPAFSPSENPNRVFSDDEKSDHGGVRKPLPHPPKLTQIDTTIPDSSSRPMYVNANSDPKRDIPVSDPTFRAPSIAVPDSTGYQLQQEQLQQHQQQLYSHLHHQQQQQQQPQQQYIPANPHYIHHPATGTVVPMSSYYPIAAHSIQQSQQAHPYDPQIPMYYVPVRQTPYNLATMQPSLGNTGPIPTAKPAIPVPRVPQKPELPASMYSTGAVAPPAALQPSLIHVAPDQAHQYPGMGYHLVQHHHLSQAPAAIGNYGYEYTADSAHPQIYYSQATSAPGLASQYQTMSSSSPMTAEGMAPGDAKATRAS